MVIAETLVQKEKPRVSGVLVQVMLSGVSHGFSTPADKIKASINSYCLFMLQSHLHLLYRERPKGSSLKNNYFCNSQ